MQKVLESRQGFGIAFGPDLDGAVGSISYPAMNAATYGGSLRERAKPDALHAAADSVETPESHDDGMARLYIASMAAPGVAPPRAGAGCRASVLLTAARTMWSNFLRSALAELVMPPGGSTIAC
jgi:hypothetical protein